MQMHSPVAGMYSESREERLTDREFYGQRSICSCTADIHLGYFPSPLCSEQTDGIRASSSAGNFRGPNFLQCHAKCAATVRYEKLKHRSRADTLFVRGGAVSNPFKVEAYFCSYRLLAGSLGMDTRVNTVPRRIWIRERVADICSIQ